MTNYAASIFWQQSSTLQGKKKDFCLLHDFATANISKHRGCSSDTRPPGGAGGLTASWDFITKLCLLSEISSSSLAATCQTLNCILKYTGWAPSSRSHRWSFVSWSVWVGCHQQSWEKLPVNLPQLPVPLSHRHWRQKLRENLGPKCCCWAGWACPAVSPLLNGHRLMESSECFIHVLKKRLLLSEKNRNYSKRGSTLNPFGFSRLVVRLGPAGCPCFPGTKPAKHLLGHFCHLWTFLFAFDIFQDPFCPPAPSPPPRPPLPLLGWLFHVRD